MKSRELQGNTDKIHMATYSVKVEFIVEAEQMGHWAAEQCATDFVQHRIDEGYPMKDNIIDWSFLSVELNEPTP
jgi:hypothetical protein